MPATIALCCNVFEDAIALRGLLEIGARYFDNLFIVHSGVGGAYSKDGTIEVAESFGATVVFDDIQKGYGFIRTRLLHECGCDFGFLLDADERFYPQLPVMTCEGSEHYPEHPNPNLAVTHKADIIDQGAHVKNLINNPQTMALRSTRRHWFDFSMKKASQNWYGPNGNKDHQLRIVRNVPSIRYTKALHEALVDDRTGATPKYVAQDEHGGAFHDHFHLFMRRTQPGHKEFNEANYARLVRGEPMIAP